MRRLRATASYGCDLCPGTTQKGPSNGSSTHVLRKRRWQMKNGIRLVFLAGTLTIACLTTNVAQTPSATLQEPPERPWSVKVFVTESGGIAVHNGSPNSHDRTK